jgi:hypothetical protein
MLLSQVNESGAGTDGPLVVDLAGSGECWVFCTGIDRYCWQLGATRISFRLEWSWRNRSWKARGFLKVSITSPERGARGEREKFMSAAFPSAEAADLC